MKKVVLFSLILALLLGLAQATTDSKITSIKSARAEGQNVGENSPFGINGHIARRYRPYERDTVFQKMGEAGIKWEREEFTWDYIEPARGSYNWSDYDDVVTRANANHINISGLIAYSARWSSTGYGNPSADKYLPNLNDWGSFVAVLVERYDGDGINDAPGSPVIKYWEMWNEPNLDIFFKINSANTSPNDKCYWYGQLLKKGYQSAKQANPNSTILSGAVSGADVYFMDEAIKKSGGVYFDIFAVNILRNLTKPEEFVTGYDTLQYQLGQSVGFSKRYQDKPIWITEAGWPTDVVSEQSQADYISRLYAISLATPNVQKTFVYTFRDDASGPWGLVKSDFSEKPAFAAYKTSAAQMENASFEAYDDPVPMHSVDDFERGVNWNVENYNGAVSSVDSHEYIGNHSLKLNYNLPEGNPSAHILLEKSRYFGDGNPVVKINVYGDNDLNTAVRLRIRDITGEIFQGYVARVPYSGWQRVIVNFNDSGQRAVHWGGDNDGTIDGASCFDSIVVDKEKDKDDPLEQAAGQIYFDDISFCFDANMLYKAYFRKQGGNRLTLLWSSSGSSSRNVFVNASQAEITAQSGTSEIQNTSSGWLNGFNFSESVSYVESQVSSPSELNNLVDPRTNPSGYSFWWDYGIPNNTTYRDWFFTQVVPNNSYLYSMLWDRAVPQLWVNQYYYTYLFDHAIPEKIASSYYYTRFWNNAVPGYWTGGFYYTRLWDKAIPENWVSASPDSYRNTFWNSAVPSGWSGNYYRSRLWDKAVPQLWTGGHYYAYLWDNMIPSDTASDYYYDTFWLTAVPYRWASSFYYARLWDRAVPQDWAPSKGTYSYKSTFWDQAVPLSWAGGHYESRFWNSAVPQNWVGAYYKNTLNNDAIPDNWAGGYYAGH